MSMKKYFNYLLMAALVGGLSWSVTACSDDDDKDDIKTITVDDDLIEHGIQVEAAGETVDVNVKMEGTWTASLDNAEEGVNYRISSQIGLKDLAWIEEKPSVDGRAAGSGVIGILPEPESAADFLRRLKDAFGVKCLMHTDPSGLTLRKVALCGGAGSFLMDEARAKGADAFITGEISYHHFFDADGMLLIAMGHYESEQFTVDLLRDFLADRFPGLRIEMTSVDTNPIHYTC